MKLFTLALDYDGTIARGDRIDQAVRDALALARSRGITVLIVTGRILDELRRVAGELHFVDGVIAENGAVLHFPDSDHTTQLAPPVSVTFLQELARRGVNFRSGSSLVDAEAAAAPVILDVIRALELPLVLIFNSGRVMAMPQGVSKGTGLHSALEILRLSARNALAIGDAENDHELLRLAEVGVAVPWGSAALQAAADLVLPGDGPGAVAAYVRDVATTGNLPPTVGRRRLFLGHTEGGDPFWLAAKGRNVLIAGDTKSGKSWIAGLLSEQLILHGYCVCVIDPEGDYRSHEALPGVTILGGDDPPPSPRDVMRALRYPDRSVVIDLSRLAQDDKRAHIQTTLVALNELRQRTGLPHRIVVDEAHYFIHDGTAGLLDLERNGYTVVTYCASRLPRTLLDSTEVIIVTCESNPAEIDALFARCERCGGNRDEWNALSRLRPGQAIALPITAESEGRLRQFTVARRLTPHVRHRQKYVDVPVSEPRAFVFSTAPTVRARTLRQFVGELERMVPRVLEPFVERGDFSRWIRDVFGDHALAAELKTMEARHRSRTSPDTIPDLIDAIRARYDLREDAVTTGATSGTVGSRNHPGKNHRPAG